MTKITIRYRKPNWKNWSYLTVDASEVEKTCQALEMQGYLVETAV